MTSPTGALATLTVDSPIGKLQLVASGIGLVRVEFESELSPGEADSTGDATSEVPTGEAAPTSADPNEVLAQASKELAEYFAGKRRSFDVPLDWASATGFRHQAQQHLATITYGETRTYKQLAEELNNPNAVRAVGSACATNPLPIVVPCHRVLRTDGDLGGYRGGVDAKRALLELEGAL